MRWLGSRVVAALVLGMFFFGTNLSNRLFSAPIAATSGPSVMSFQGQVLVGGTPYAGSGSFKFAIVDAAGTTTFWSNDNSSSVGSEPAAGVPLNVAAGVFSVLLGDTSLAGMTAPLTPGVFAAADRRLRVWFATSSAGPFSLLSPDQPLASVPFAFNAETVDGIDGAELQRRILAACGVGSAITAVDANGTPTCTPFGSLSAVATNGTLTGTGTTLSPLGVNTGTVQTRVSGSCVVGSEIRVIANDGTVGCGPLSVRVTAPMTNTITTVDSVGVVGQYTSITIGADGLPIVGYYDVTNGNLRVLHCGDPRCAAGNTITPVDTAGDVGRFTSIAIGTDGLAIISYYDVSNQDLKVYHCANLACTSGTATAIDTANNVGQYTSITIGTDGLPIISYYDVTNQDLKVAHCAAIDCAGAGNSIATPVFVNNVGQFTSIAIGANGLPIVSFYDATQQNITVVTCSTVTCAGFTNSLLSTGSGAVGRYTSIAIGSDLLPVISYFDDTNGFLVVLHCDNDFCPISSPQFNVLNVGPGDLHSSLTIGADGFPIVSVYENVGQKLRVARCRTVTCTSAAATTIDNVGNVGQYTAITIGADGAPIIAYFDVTKGDLKVAHLGSTTGVPFARR